MRITLLGPSGHIGGAERVLLDCVQVADGYPGAELSVISLGRGPLLAAATGLGAKAVVVDPPASLAALGDSFASAGSVMLRMLPALAGSPAFIRRFSRARVSVLTRPGPLARYQDTRPRRAAAASRAGDLAHSRLSEPAFHVVPNPCPAVTPLFPRHRGVGDVAADARRCLPDHLKVQVVHNSVNTEAFRPEGPAADLDAMSGLPPAPQGTIRIGLPATFARWKGHETFLSAVAKLGRRVPGLCHRCAALRHREQPVGADRTG